MNSRTGMQTLLIAAHEASVFLTVNKGNDVIKVITEHCEVAYCEFSTMEEAMNAFKNLDKADTWFTYWHLYPVGQEALDRRHA